MEVSTDQIKWEELPTEALLNILRYLTPKELCLSTPVSKPWQQLVEDDSLWREICLSSTNFEVKEQEETQMTWKEIFCNRLTCSLEEHVLNVLLIGERNQGKQNMMRRFIANNSCLSETEGFIVSERNWFHDFLTINLKLWDVAGHEDLHRVPAIREICGAMVIVESTAERPLEEARELKASIDASFKLPIILIFNKGAGLGVEIPQSELTNFCKENGFLMWYENDDTLNQGFDWALHRVVKVLTENEKLKAQEEPQIHISYGVAPPPPNKKCIIC